MPNAPFTVGLVQEIAGSRDLEENVARAIAGVRSAHARGAQVICLQELFNAPYFCKSLDINWFDLAEPIPGPTTERMQALARGSPRSSPRRADLRAAGRRARSPTPPP